MKVVEKFFRDYRLADIPQIMNKLLTAAITTKDEFGTGEKRAAVIHFAKNMLLLLEGSWMISREKKRDGQFYDRVKLARSSPRRKRVQTDKSSISNKQ